ncbi:MAG: DUF4268 domain-containing protein, partial [Cyclobacteriaceae bacterium]|nr:DUF4268 domain-containing protein [Cyclobacteriaceae bacterium]
DSQEELNSRHYLRKEFWIKLLKLMNTKSSLFQNISPSIYNWIGAGSGVRGFGYNFVISKSFGRCEIYIDRGTQEETKFMFDYLFKNREAIESDFGKKLIWERLDDKRASRIKYEDTSFNVFNKDCWDNMAEFLADGMVRMEATFKNHIKKVGQKLKNEEI